MASRQHSRDFQGPRDVGNYATHWDQSVLRAPAPHTVQLTSAKNWCDIHILWKSVCKEELCDQIQWKTQSTTDSQSILSCRGSKKLIMTPIILFEVTFLQLVWPQRFLSYHICSCPKDAHFHSLRCPAIVSTLVRLCFHHNCTEPSHTWPPRGQEPHWSTKVLTDWPSRP